MVRILYVRRRRCNGHFVAFALPSHHQSHLGERKREEERERARELPLPIDAHAPKPFSRINHKIINQINGGVFLAISLFAKEPSRN